VEHMEVKKKNKRMKKLGLSAVVATTFAIAAPQAVASTDTPSKTQRETASDERFDSFFGNAAENMKKMRNNFSEYRKNHANKKANGISGEYKASTNGGTLQDIATREDANSVFYDVKIKDLDSTSVNTDVKDGYITITGLQEKQSEYNTANAAGRGLSKSGFQRTFPLPQNVDQHKMKMTAEKDKVVLEFPKIKS